LHAFAHIAICARAHRARGRRSRRWSLCGFRRDDMGSIKMVIGSLLIAAGALGLAYGSFSYPKETHSAKVGPVSVQVQERGTSDVPVGLRGGASVVGVLLLVVFRCKE